MNGEKIRSISSKEEEQQQIPNGFELN